MNDSQFKRTTKFPSCTMSPWFNLIPKDKRDIVMRKIRQETIEAYGYSMDECPKRKTCFTKTCLGRPLPLKSETAKPYIEQLKTTHTIINDELFISNCDNCKIAKTCKSPCYQLNDFLNRGFSKEPELISQENLELIPVIQNNDDVIKNSLINIKEIPWDCLTETRQSVIKKYLYENKDFFLIAKELDLNNQARVKYEFYSALTRLSEFAVIRKFIKDNKNTLYEENKSTYNILDSLYNKNMTMTEIGKLNNISKQAVQQRLTRFLNTYNIKWTIFVKKQGNKIIYNVPGLFK